MSLSRRDFVVGAASVAATGGFLDRVDSDSARARTPRPRSARSLQALLNRAGDTAVVHGYFVLDRTVTIPNRLKSLELAADAIIEVRGDRPALSRAGDIHVRDSTSPIDAGSSQLVAPAADLSIGDHVLISGHDTIPGSVDKYGYIRRIVDLSSGVAELDSPLPRRVSRAPRYGVVRFAPTIHLYGRGKVVNGTPEASTTTLIDLIAVESPVITGIEVANNGGPGITLSHCMGGDVDAWIHDLLDDGERHFGYGVNVAGASRYVRVRGDIARVRHAVTTSPGPPIAGFGYAGEPEDCIFEPRARDCTNKAIDTHRAGWGTKIIPHVRGGYGGVQIRSDNTSVVGGSIVDTGGPAIAVERVVAVAPVIEGVVISGVTGGGNAILALSPATVRDTDIRDCSGVAIVLNSDSAVYGGSVDLGNPTAVEFRGERNTVEGIVLGETITTPYRQTDRARDNTFSASPRSALNLPGPVCIELPEISGLPQVGATLTASTGTWSLSGLDFEWSWKRDGVRVQPVDDASPTKYRVTAADLGTRISATVTAKRAGHRPSRAASLPSRKVRTAGRLHPRERPRVTGSAKPGAHLYVSTGEWVPYPDSIQVEWRRDSEPIPGANERSYQLRASDRFAVVSVRVTAHREGFEDGTLIVSGVLVSGLEGPLGQV